MYEENLGLENGFSYCHFATHLIKARRKCLRLLKQNEIPCLKSKYIYGDMVSS